MGAGAEWEQGTAERRPRTTFIGAVASANVRCLLPWPTSLPAYIEREGERERLLPEANDLTEIAGQAKMWSAQQWTAVE